MISPGRHYVNGNVRISARIYNSTATDIDPTTLVFKVMNPFGVATTYTYGDGDDVSRESAGNFYIDVTPDTSGKWYYRWEATGSGYALAREGTFAVEKSPFYDDAGSDYGRR